MPSEAKLVGKKEMDKTLRRLAKSMPDAVALALYVEAASIFEESQNQVPVDTGNLRKSGLVSPVLISDNFTVYVSYNTSYAIRMHEDTSLDANRIERGQGKDAKGKTTGKSKYLQEPFENASAGMEGRIVKNARRFQKQGRGLKEARPIKGKK